MESRVYNDRYVVYEYKCEKCSKVFETMNQWFSHITDYCGVIDIDKEGIVFDKEVLRVRE